ncbi:hypothetical protein AP1_0043 [Aeromonas phage AP1]|uniref:Uncharacterized protein n=1 Tax=Aeromonas phage AS-szw TaxID=2026114 RepID=A0A291LDR6_9CAUD|nr:hypothetical protein [Aeromonas phage AS-szw]QMV28761.1 hypothetical protein AP1_0043 [Aeromonas phage AP1]
MAIIRKEQDREVKEKLTESDIQGYFGTYFPMQKKYDLIVPNCFYTHDLEADLLAFRKSGFRDEFEIKISRADFKNDVKKMVKIWPERDNGRRYKADLEEMTKYEALEKGRLLNYFWYIVPHGLITPEEIPTFAGLMYIETVNRHNQKYQFRVIKDAKRLHGNKSSQEDYDKSLRKLGYRYWNLVEKNIKNKHDGKQNEIDS